MTEHIDSMMEDYSAIGAEAYWEQKEPILPTVDRQIEVLISNVEEIREYVIDTDVEADFTAICELLTFAKRNSDMSGVFLAHHMLSDLSYWGFNYGLNTLEYSTWEGEIPSRKEKDCYYGVTKTWGCPYPASILKIVGDRITAESKSGGEELSKRIGTGDQSTASLIDNYSRSEIQEIRILLDDIDSVLCETLYGSSEKISETKYDATLSQINKLVKKTAKTTISADVNSAKGLFERYGNISEGSVFDFEGDKKFLLISCHRIVSELSGIVFNNDHPTQFNNPYYGALKLLEPDKPSSKQYEYYIETETPPMDETDTWDDFFKNKIPLISPTN
jgi:hypothetical protein